MSKDLVLEAREKIGPIIEAIDALDQRWQALGSAKAFDVHDPQTKASFDRFWSVTFGQHFPPALQDQIVGQMENHHQRAIGRMRKIGVASEIELERGCSEAAAQLADTFLERKDGWEPATHIRELKERIERTTDTHAAAELRRQLEKDQVSAFYALLKDYPYHTYYTLVGGEIPLVASLDGLPRPAQEQGLHLVIEAGAIPFTAVLSSIARHGGEVVGTIEDKESFRLGRQLVERLEKLGIVEPGKIRLVNAPPAMAPRLDFPRRPYLATITQVLEGKFRTEGVIRELGDAGINAVVVRGAHGLTRLLYEPLDDVRLPTGFRQHCVGLPKQDDEGGPACYNSSHLISTHKYHGCPKDTPTHRFEDVANGMGKKTG